MVGLGRYASDGIDARTINTGWCLDFASAVVALVSDAAVGSGCPADPDPDSHAYVVYEGRYYDSECLDGATRPQDLPFYKRLLGPNETNKGGQQWPSTVSR